MSQTKKMSFIESITNTFVGFIITLIVSPVIYYLCDVKISVPQMGMATLLFTVVSIARNYFVRRFFTKPIKQEEV
jgi:uncharacterized membrane protein